MQESYSLIQSLTAGEWQSLQQYLTCFSSHDSVQLKQLQLARILRESETCPEHNACSIKIYGTKNDISFDVLKTRLKEKVLDFLLTDISTDKQQDLDEADYAIIKMKKKSAQFHQLFYSKKRIPLLYSMLDDIINMAKEYEQYFILIEHLKAKKNIVSFKIGKEEFEKINKEMKYYWRCNRMVNKAEHYYYESMMLNDYSGKADKEKLSSFLEKANAKLEGYCAQTTSALIKYYHKFLKMESFWLKENYSKARSVCLELLDVVRNNKSVYRRQRIGVVYDHLSRCDFYLKHFKQAAEYAQLAQEHFNLNSENYCIALEQEFYAVFAMPARPPVPVRTGMTRSDGKEYGGAVEIANKMIASATPKELGAFRHAKYNYLLANALFKQRRFLDALNILSQGMEISKDKAGWEIGLRVLKIMTLIELLKLNEASLAVRSLKQFFQYTDKKTPISLRDKTILALLCQAERVGFLFTLLNGNTEKHMNVLSPPLPSRREGDSSPSGSVGGALPWEPFTHEVIPFHEWFAGKMKKPIPDRPASKKGRKKV